MMHFNRQLLALRPPHSLRRLDIVLIFLFSSFRNSPAMSFDPSFAIFRFSTSVVSSSCLSSARHHLANLHLQHFRGHVRKRVPLRTTAEVHVTPRHATVRTIPVAAASRREFSSRCRFPQYRAWMRDAA